MTIATTDPEKDSRSERLLTRRRICFDHAKDLIESAKRALAQEPSLPNIAFHLVLLAIEEMGKAGLIASREVSAGSRDTSWIDKRLDDHAFKILWGLWTPEFDTGRELNPERFEQIKRFSQQAHVRRLEGLYVGENLERDSAVPKDAVGREEVRSLLHLARANLETLEAKGSPDVDAHNDLLRWFWETIDDEIGQKRLFSVSFVAKYAELNNDPREWVRWARDEFARIRESEQALLNAELARSPDANSDFAPRWRLNVRIYSVSHSIRPKILNVWNEKIRLGKLKFAKSDEMLLELTLGEQVNIGDLYDAGMALSKLIIACLNVGTAGFFWYEMPPSSTGYFEKAEDLANPTMRLDLGRGFDLQRHWLVGEDKRKLTVLEEMHLDNAATCAVMFGPMPESEAAPIFGPYLHGLTFLGKSDTHLSLDNHAFSAFDTALRNALKHFGDWDGEAASFLPALHRIFSEVIPEAEHRDVVFKHFISPPQSHREMQEYVISAKRVVDLYLVLVAHRLWDQKISEIPQTSESQVRS